MSLRIEPYKAGYALIVDGVVSCYGLSFAALAVTARALILREGK